MQTSYIRVIQYNKKLIVEKELKQIEEIGDLLQKDKVTWLNIDGLQDIALVEKIGSYFNISSLALEDILNTDQRPRFIEDEHNLIIITKSLTYLRDENNIHIEQISFIIGENYLISFQERVGDHFDPVRERLRNNKGRIRAAGADYLWYALFDTLVDNYIRNIETIGGDIELLENRLLENDKGLVMEIHHYKTEITFIRKNIRPIKEIISHIHMSESRLIHKNTIIFIDDLNDLITQATEAIEIYYTIVSDQLNIYHTNISNRVNDVMKVLTVFAAIFIPLTFIAGVYGTNFDYLPELHYKYSYFIMLGVMLAMALGMLYYFRRKKWL